VAGWPQGTSSIDVQDLIQRARRVNAAPVQGEKENVDESMAVLRDTMVYLGGIELGDQALVAKRLNEEYEKPPKYVSKLQPRRRGAALTPEVKG
jgi:hypothetical protein